MHARMHARTHACTHVHTCMHELFQLYLLVKINKVNNILNIRIQLEDPLQKGQLGDLTHSHIPLE